MSRVCFSFSKTGRCKLGSACPYSHGSAKTSGTALYGGSGSVRPGACFAFARSGKCERGSSCPYRHESPASGQSRQSQQTPNSSTNSFKRGVCYAFQNKGVCPRGDLCQYLHDNPSGSSTPPFKRVRSGTADGDSFSPPYGSAQSPGTASPSIPLGDSNNISFIGDSNSQSDMIERPLHDSIPCLCDVTPKPDDAGTTSADAEVLEVLERQLNEKQRRIVDLAVAGKSVFFSGAAGTGKSFTLAVLAAKLRSIGKQVCVCASTGVAASNIGGVTVHSWAGIGLGRDRAETHFYKISKNVNAMGAVLYRWKTTDVLIIDEISMLSGQLFDKLCEIGQRIRTTGPLEPDETDQPFGGIQLILVGDFHQLPPVWQRMDSLNQAELLRTSQHLNFAPPSVAVLDRALFCFETRAWKKLISPGCVVELTQVYRQRDAKFLELLQAVRHGCEDPLAAALVRDTLASLRTPLRERLTSHAASMEEIEPTRLYTTNADVDNFNIGSLRALFGNHREYVYTCVDTIFPSASVTDRGALEKALNGEKELHLRVGAQVMLLFNVNVLEGLVNGSRGVVIGFEKRRCDSTATQEFATATEKLVLPVVRFTNERELVVCPVTREVELAGITQATRTQLPLKLAWAVTVHKSQGLSLDCVEVDLSNCFAPGQGYVALSRCRSLEGLQVSAFSERAFSCNRIVKAWYEENALDSPVSVVPVASAGASASVFAGEEAATAGGAIAAQVEKAVSPNATTKFQLTAAEGRTDAGSSSSDHPVVVSEADASDDLLRSPNLGDHHAEADGDHVSSRSVIHIDIDADDMPMLERVWASPQ